MARIVVIGAGYVGLPSAACLAHLGHSVTCIDSDEERVQRLRRADPVLSEDGLAELLEEGIANGRLRFDTNTLEAVSTSEFVLLCLPTPPLPDGEADVSTVNDVARFIAPSLPDRAVVIAKSTMPVGSSTALERILRDAGAPPSVTTVANPEFLREGVAVSDFLNPDRVVIGAAEESTAARVAALYDRIDAPIVMSNRESAEIIKYAANAFLATKISYVNELANACEALGADVQDVVRGLGHDPRIGFGWLNPGPGWGGSCLPKDTAAFLHTTRAAGYSFQLLRCAVDVNDQQRQRVVDIVREAVDGDLRGARVAMWGATFKANTDDLRDSPALEIAAALMNEGVHLAIFDPAARPDDLRARLDVELAPDMYSACAAADVLVVTTEWEHFASADLRHAAEQMARPSIVDARNIIDPKQARDAGFAYRGLGR